VGDKMCPRLTGHYISSIENFWNQVKRHMRIFRQYFSFFLRECEWRPDIGTPGNLLVDFKSLLKDGD
jgi:transposase-like protein